MNRELWLSHADETRPQVDLQQRVWDELRWEPESDTSGVTVSTENFVATLSGMVPSYHARVAAQQAAERVPGIRSVRNELVVVLAPGDAHADAVLAAAVANTLKWDVRIPHVNLTEQVTNGWVTLGGSVTRQCERAAAEEAVANLTGVRGITNRIAIDPPARPRDFEHLARVALERAALPHAHILLEAHDKTVALRGKVHSLADRLAAERAVWRVPGIAAVEDQLTVH